MIYLQTIIFGFLQGITEFVPVSSSGHLVVLHDVLQAEVLNSLAFDVALHIGTLIALIIYFYKDLAKYLVAFLQSFRKCEVKTNDDQKLAWLIAFSIIPAGLVGYFFEDAIDLYFRDSSVVATMLIVGALLFFIVEKVSKQTKDMKSLGWGSMIFIACAQVLALIPGTSRSGITITAGMFANFSREAATRFSFLMSVPIVFLAGLKKTIDVFEQGISTTEIGYYLIGILTAAVFGYLAIAYMLKFVQKHSLAWFAWYRIILALIILFFI